MIVSINIQDVSFVSSVSSSPVSLSTSNEILSQQNLSENFLQCNVMKQLFDLQRYERPPK